MNIVLNKILKVSYKSFLILQQIHWNFKLFANLETQLIKSENIYTKQCYRQKITTP